MPTLSQKQDRWDPHRVVPSVWGTAQSHQQHYQLLPPNAHTPSISKCGQHSSSQWAPPSHPSTLLPPPQATPTPCLFYTLSCRPLHLPATTCWAYNTNIDLFLLNWDPKEELEVNSSFQAAFLTKLQALSLSCLMGYFPPCIYKHVVIHIDLGLSIKNIFYIKTGCQPKWTVHIIRCYCQS